MAAEPDRAAMTRCGDAEMSGKFDVLRLTRDRDALPRLHPGAYVWLGDLADWKLVGDYDALISPVHRPCWKPTLGGPYAHLVDEGPFLGNIVTDALMHRCEMPGPRVSFEVRQLGYLVQALSAVGCFIRTAEPGEMRQLAEGARTTLGKVSRLVSPAKAAAP